MLPKLSPHQRGTYAHCWCMWRVCMHVYVLCALYIKYMVKMFGVSLPQILELEHQTFWMLYTHIGPPNPPILAPCVCAMPVHKISSLSCVVCTVWQLHPCQAGPRCFNPGLSILPEFSSGIWTLFLPPPTNYGSSMGWGEILKFGVFWG